MRRAIIGDVHGSIDELILLYKKLQFYSIDEIWHVGDLVDRGLDSGAVVQFCKENNILGVKGNHEDALLDWRDAVKTQDKINKKPETHRSFQAIRPQDWSYIENLPNSHYFDAMEAILVHAGVYPRLPVWQQGSYVKCLQMIHPNRKKGDTRWWIYDKNLQISEEDSRKEGWIRWYEKADDPSWIVYGHSVYPEPLVYNRTIGIDTGCVFGGHLTAVILPFTGEFVSVKAKKTYFEKWTYP